MAQKEVFEWLRDEYRFYKMPSRLQRDVDAVNGDTWYKNYQIKECQSSSNKSSFCKGHHVGQKEKHAPEISELFDDLNEKDKATWSTTVKEREASDGEKLQLPTHRESLDNSNNIVGDFAERINDKNMKLEHQEQHLFPVSDHRDSNYSPNIEARLSAKHYLAQQQNAIREIEMKHQHQHLPSDDHREPSKKLMGVNEIQLGDTSSNSDLSSNDIKRSLLGQKQTNSKHLDDQIDQKKNDLYDEVNDKLSRHEQQGLQTLHRVKRRDTSEINKEVIKRLSKEKLEEFLQTQHDDG